jgi:hypothetical protein
MSSEAVDLEGLSDEELFNEANADEVMTEEVVAEPAPAEPEQHRDEQGRFAQAEQPVTTAATEQPAGTQVDDNAAMIPSFRLKQEADARRQLETDLANERAERAALRQRLEALERPAPKVEPKAEEEPDPLLDPKAYREFIREETRKEILNDRREASLAQAHKTHGKEFEEAYAAAQERVDPVLKAKMQNSRDPGETLIAWHREKKVMAEVGNDPNAFFDRRLDAFLKDPANQAKVLERIRGGAQTQQQPGGRQASPVSLPPSLTKATNASSDISADDDDVSNDGLWKHANS